MNRAVEETGRARSRARWRIGILLLLLLGTQAALRVNLMVRSDVIAKDGAYFIRMMRHVVRDPVGGMREYPLHPGYPYLTAGVHAVLTGNWEGQQREPWEQAGCVVAFLSSLACILGVWYFTRRAFGNDHIAFWGAMLFGLGSKFAALGADVLSDASLQAFQVWGVIVLLLASKAIPRRAQRALCLAGLVGVLSGLAYLVRPEGLQVLLVAAIVWSVVAVRGRHWKTWFGMAVTSAVGALLVMAPYMAVIGGVTAKWKAKDFQVSLGRASGMLATLYPVDDPVLLRLAGRFFEAMNPVLAGLACLYLVLWVIARLGRWADAKRLRTLLPVPDRQSGWVILLIWVTAAIPLGSRYLATGAMSHRYLMLPACLMAGLPAAAGVGIARLIIEWVGQARAKHVWRGLVIAAVALAVGLGIHASRPLHKSKTYVKTMGLYLKDRIQPDDRIAYDDYFLSYYLENQAFLLGGGKGWRNLESPNRYLKDQLTSPRQPFEYVVITVRLADAEHMKSERYHALREQTAAEIAVLKECGYELRYEVAQTAEGRHKRKALRLYEYRGSASQSAEQQAGDGS